MKREIKFRAWDTKRNQWISDYAYSELMLDFYGSLFRVATDSCESPISEVYNYIIEQYTGLKDKNGKEIYEGDILTYDYADNKDVKEWMLKAHFIVRYEKDYIICGSDIKPERKLFLHGFRFKFTEIIGNIHEHPNLLTILTNKTNE